MNRQTRLYVIAAAILLVGLVSAVFTYFTAPDEADNLMVYEFEQSKMYRHDLELYGGKLNVLSSELVHWFQGLWHGRQLAFTIAFISAVIACLVYFAAKLSHPDHDPDHRDSRGQ